MFSLNLLDPGTGVARDRFQVVPAIDIMNGVCLRLVQGRADQIATQAGDPVEMARRFAGAGAASLHVVDLDGAFAGHPVNLGLVERIAAATGLPVEVGGGLRSDTDVRCALDNGATWVILGSRAVREPAWLAAMACAHPGRILAGLDLKGGKLAVDGWKGAVGADPEEVLRLAQAGLLPLAGAVITDTSRDGTLGGVDAPALARVLHSLAPFFPKGARLLAAGGVGGHGDLETLAALAPLGLAGAVVGRAFYDGKLSSGTEGPNQGREPTGGRGSSQRRSGPC